MRKFIVFLLLSSLFFANIVINIHHSATATPPKVDLESNGRGTFFSRSDIGLNHIFLEGSSFERGKVYGELTKNLLLKQENEMMEKLSQLFPNDFSKRLLLFSLMIVYRGIEKWYDTEHLKEMYGVSLSAPKLFEEWANNYTRQVGYHALHEAGQTMVDNDLAPMACTLLATPTKSSWILGRVFDFEAGRTFDEEKIVKWVFPKRGKAFMHVIWSGMVGAVTGVNEDGLYVSINAAGSDDFRFEGTPSTLILTKILQHADSGDDAIQILRESQMMITDIFVVFDRKKNELYRVEKSPSLTLVTKETNPVSIANHLVHEGWKNDKTNKRRMKNLTTVSRQKRGQELIQPLKLTSNYVDRSKTVLNWMRDKSPYRLKKKVLGHRGAINGLIATHGVIYDGESQNFFISRGPSLVGEFIGYNLPESFKEKRPIETQRLSQDPDLNKEQYYTIKTELNRADSLLAKIALGECESSKKLFQLLNQSQLSHPRRHLALGNYINRCKGDFSNALVEWRKAKNLHPAYKRDRDILKDRGVK